MYKLGLFTACLISGSLFSQGFFTSNSNWNAPNGGFINGGTTFGFFSTGGSSSPSNNTGSQNWGTMDMNGDGKPDLVVFAQLQAGNVTCFSPGSNPYWKVYLNNGTSFSSTETSWSLPLGGKISGGTTYGFNNAAGTAISSDNTGSQTWGLQDVNGDSKPDLVVFAQLQGGNVTSFSPSSSQYWKVYLNSGSGFSSTPSNWSLPAGGSIIGGNTLGFVGAAGTAQSSNNTGSQSWTLADMDGDAKPDLVVCAQLQAGNVTCFSPGSNQYWKVYSNNGSGFVSTPTNWNLPNGGRLTGGTSYGFDNTSGSANSSDNTGAQSWAITDLTGDKKPDLVVTAQLQAGNVTCFSPGSNQYWKVYTNTGSAFNTTPVNWSLPNGGAILGGTTFGFNSIGYSSNSSHNTGSQTWSIMDFDTDNRPDLVICAQMQAGNTTCFSPGNAPYWKVYGNNGGGFNNNVVNWPLPLGGSIIGGTTYGFNQISGSAAAQDNTGSQTWVVMDIDGDAKPNLVVTAQLQGGNVTSFSPSSSQYWKVYGSDAALSVYENLGTLGNHLVFPNPSNGNFIVKGFRTENVEVISETGQIIAVLKLSADNNYEATLKGLKPGFYILNAGGYNSKIIVTQ